MKAFNSFVRPILEFSSVIWNPMATRGNINKIESVQRRFTKRLSGFGKLCYESRLTVLKTESLERRRLQTDLIICYKILNGIVNVNRDSFFVMAETSRTRGHCTINLIA